MTKKSLKKYLITGLSILLVGSVLYFIFISYLVSNGFRDYKEFCAHYIPMIEQYRHEHKVYPAGLNAFKKPEYYPRYDVKDCGYIQQKDEYTLFAPAGLIGAYIYTSEDNKWRYD